MLKNNNSLLFDKKVLSKCVERVVGDNFLENFVIWVQEHTFFMFCICSQAQNYKKLSLEALKGRIYGVISVM